MAGHGLDRAQPAVLGGLLALQHQHRRQLDRAVDAGAGQNLAREPLILARRIHQHLLVGRLQGDIGDQAEEVMLLALDNHEVANADALHRCLGVQTHRQTLNKRSLRDSTDTLTFRHGNLRPYFPVGSGGGNGLPMSPSADASPRMTRITSGW